MERARSPDRTRSLPEPAVLAAIGDLSFVARVTVEGTVAGLHRSPFHGYSAEFSQYRHYRPGDDLKYVDWKLLGRTDRVYTRQYRETTNVAAGILLDTSGSMAFSGAAGVSKFACARMLAAALAYLVSTAGDSVGLVGFGDGLDPCLPSRSGPTHLRSLLVALARATSSGGTAAAAGLRRGVDLLRRRGVLFVISDLYDEDAGVERALRRAARIGHDVAVFHVLAREELAFPYDGDVELEDLETGQRLRTGGPDAAAAYRERVTTFLERWRARCLKYGVQYTRILTDEPLDVGLRAWLLGRGRGAP